MILRRASISVATAAIIQVAICITLSVRSRQALITTAEWSVDQACQISWRKTSRFGAVELQIEPEMIILRSPLLAGGEDPPPESRAIGDLVAWPGSLSVRMIERRMIRDTATEYGFGFPCPALGYITMWDEDGFPMHICSLNVLGSHGTVYHVPYYPYWIGLFVNIGALSLVIGIVWLLVCFLITTLRRLRGCCIYCGYSMLGLRSTGPCPECGHLRAPAARPQP